MCLALVAWRVHERYPLVLAANRDEFHDRPAEPLHWWEDPPMLAGRDLAAGGAWCALDRAGRMALVTNYRDPSLPRPTGQSRGRLPCEFLGGDAPAEDYARSLLARAGGFAGFSLLAMDGQSLAYVVSHPAPELLLLEPGIYGLSNRRLDTPWPKVLRTRERFGQELSRMEPDPAGLFAMLSDRRQAPDEELPDTGVGRDWERLLSAPFIVSATYGTRCSTVILARNDGMMTVEERSHATDGAPAGRTRMAFVARPSRC